MIGYSTHSTEELAHLSCDEISSIGIRLIKRERVLEHGIVSIPTDRKASHTSILNVNTEFNRSTRMIFHQNIYNDLRVATMAMVVHHPQRDINL
jgi:hypothetical protein